MELGQVIRGGVVSITVMGNTHVAVLLARSAVVAVTLVIPTAKRAGLGMEKVRLVLPQLSAVCAE